jgi:hypothetical protein
MKAKKEELLLIQVLHLYLGIFRDNLVGIHDV